MASQKDNLKALADLGITTDASAVEGILPLKGDESAKDVAEILKNAKAILKAAKEAAGQGGNEGGEDDAEKVYVWVKGRAYVNAEDRVDGGLYLLAANEIPERLAKSPTIVVEVFADGIPPRKMTEIAKWAGVTHTEDFSDEELLAKLTTPHFKTF